MHELVCRGQDAAKKSDLHASYMYAFVCRYDAQIAVIGRSLQAQLAGLNLFLVGAGALGCEFMKVCAYFSPND